MKVTWWKPPHGNLQEWKIQISASASRIAIFASTVIASHQIFAYANQVIVAMVVPPVRIFDISDIKKKAPNMKNKNLLSRGKKQNKREICLSDVAFALFQNQFWIIWNKKNICRTKIHVYQWKDREINSNRIPRCCECHARHFQCSLQ